MLDTHKTYCPYCGEPIDLVVDLSVVEQEYIEDCFVCCRPMVVNVTVIDDENTIIEVRNENE